MEGKRGDHIELFPVHQTSALTWFNRHMSASLLLTFPAIIFSIIAAVGSLPLPCVLAFSAAASSLCCLCELVFVCVCVCVLCVC